MKHTQEGMSLIALKTSTVEFIHIQDEKTNLFKNYKY